MGDKNIRNSDTSQLDQSIKIQTTSPEDVDGAEEGVEVRWINNEWTTYNSYYKNHIPVRSVINKLGMWSVGKGFKADKRTTKILEKIRGIGKDTFNGIMNNQKRIQHVNGDSYAEIITEDGGELKENGSNLTNLKPLNPGRIGHRTNDEGMLIGYTQENIDGTKTDLELNQVFHLMLNRTADEIHGTGDIKSLISFLDKIKQLDEDMAVMFHRFVVPLVIWKLNTDDKTTIEDFKAKSKIARNGGDDMVIPEEAVSWDLLEAGKNGVDPMTWRNKWVEEVIKGGGVPALIMAIEAGTTEASSKMVYLAWQQVIEDAQLNLEEQVLAQLHLKIKYEFPARIEENLGEDEGKDGDINKSIKSETEITTKKINGGEKK